MGSLSHDQPHSMPSYKTDVGMKSLLAHASTLAGSAAARAAETNLVDAYLRDPLAGILAGEKAVRESQASREKGSDSVTIATCMFRDWNLAEPMLLHDAFRLDGVPR